VTELMMENFRLGKQEAKEDERTLRMANFLSVPPSGIPATYDFERGRSNFPTHTWGNDEWGDCVVAGRANQQQRLQRIESRLTIPLTDQMVVDTYKRMTGAQNPGDQNDVGLVVLDALKDWRAGWYVPVWKKGRTYSIDAFGALDPKDGYELRAAAYLLTGIQFGLWLPITAYHQISKGQAWDVTSTTGDGEPGSWGGHLVYTCHYDSGGWYVWTWGQKQYATDKFIQTYADEAYAVVQTNETHSRYLDVDALQRYLTQIGAIRQ